MKQDVHSLIHDYFQDRGWVVDAASSTGYGIASDYQPSLGEVLESEGGYSNDAGDPGGPTKYGITIIDARMYWKHNATAADVKAMPLSVAKDIYKSKYWDKVHGDELPAGVDYSVFDYGVNSGVSRALKVLHGLTATCRTPAKLINAINDERIAFLRGLRTWHLFGKGWATRVAKVRRLSLAMAAKAPEAPKPPVVVAPPAKPKVYVPELDHYNTKVSPRGLFALLWAFVTALLRGFKK